MRVTNHRNRFLKTVIPICCIAVLENPVHGQNSKRRRSQLKEPVFRVADATPAKPAAATHPLNKLIVRARTALEHSQQNIHGYSTELVKREQVNGELLKHQFIAMKIRNERRNVNGRTVAPLSVYMNFLAPNELKGREVLYVKGQNNNKLYAHEGSGFRSLLSVWLDPDGEIAMAGQRYPIYKIGIENLLLSLIDRAQLEMKAGKPEHYDLKIIPGAKVEKRRCTCYQIKHLKSTSDVYMARVFFDDEYKIPIRYVTWS